MRNFIATLIVIGIVIFVVWLFLAGKIGPPGSLPGDIAIQSGGSTVYIPLGLMILASIVISAVYWIFKR